MSEMGKILKELDRMVGDEEEAKASAEMAARAEKEEAGVEDILKHIDAVEAAADFIDKMTPGEYGEDAFDAEVALRKALSKMRELADTAYEEDKKDKEPEEIEEV